MITRIKLKNFKRHEDLTVSFGPGVCLIKGANEAGKTTVAQALVYAFFGARALPLSLNETVTWGKPESSLRVEMDFMHAGVPFSIYRQKAGAELTGPGVVSSGHAEVTRFVEELLGLSADTAAKLILANQNDLRGTLASGATASIQLIESLAGFNLLDDLVSKIQAQRPCGRTDSMEQMLATEQQILPPAPLDISALTREALDATGRKQAVQSEIANLTLRLESPDFAEAARKLAVADAAKASLQTVSGTLAIVEDWLGKHPETSWSEQAIIDLEKGRERHKEESAVREAALRFSKRYIRGSVWTGTLPDLKAEIARQEAEVVGARRALGSLDEKIGVAKGEMVKEGECSFCGLSLDGIPAVAERNAKMAFRITGLQQEKSALSAEVATAISEKAELEHLLTEHEAQERSMTSPYIVLVDSESLPYSYKWVGPDAQDELIRLNYDGLIRLERQAQKEQVERTIQIREVHAKRSATMDEQARLEALLADPTLKDAMALGAEHRVGQTRLEGLRHSAERHAERAREIQQTITDAQAEFRRQQEAFDASLLRQASLSASITAMNFHNTLIGKLRDARPEVAKRLWLSVLGTVSHYMSKIRGTPCTVTRGPAGFLVDGRPAAALSGSTLDGLGLAIRIALTKTFLPSLRFMLLDEPAAATDEAREANMLGTLASADFEQLIMITHSDRADAFAAGVIQL